MEKNTKKQITRGVEVLGDTDLIDYYESLSSLREKINILVNLIRESTNTIIYTGDGVYLTAGSKEPISRPSFGEIAIAMLQKENVFGYVITTNDEDYQRKAGINIEKFIDVYGDPQLQICDKCGKKYYNKANDFVCTTESCNGKNFTNGHITEGQPILQSTLTDIERLANEAELAIVFGCTMRIKPISRLPVFPYLKRKNGKTVICHTKTTPFDMDAVLRIYAYTDDVLYLLMQELKINCPPDKGYNSNIEEKYPEKPILPEIEDTQIFRKTLQEAGKRYLPWTCVCGFVNESYPSICEKCDVRNPNYAAIARSADTGDNIKSRQILAELLVWGRH